MFIKKVFPQFLNAFQGRTIKVIAPASGLSAEKLALLHELSQRSEIDFGFRIEIPENLQDIQTIPYHANTDEIRFDLLEKALCDDAENTIIWALRGGYGSARLLDDLQKLPRPKQSKIFIGFSDNTALHLFLSQQWSWKTIHGSGFSQCLDSKQDPENFLKIAEMISSLEVKNEPFSDLKSMNACAVDSIIFEAPWTGGNLTLVENSIGTHWQIQTEGKVLLLEEVGEKGYRVDRSFYHLYQAGLFQEVKAIILGQFSAPANTPKDDNSIDIALQRFADDMYRKIHIPVFQTSQFGHGNVNYPWFY
jgi:muramoyltetrapeptide carboxypeptidase